MAGHSSATCEWPIGQGTGRPKRKCGKSTRWVNGKGETISVQLYEGSTGVIVGLCCAPTISREMRKTLEAQHPDYALYRPEEMVVNKSKREWFRWALTDIAPAKVGGLKRLDNSAADEVGMSYIPIGNVRKVE